MGITLVEFGENFGLCPIKVYFIKVNKMVSYYFRYLRSWRFTVELIKMRQSRLNYLRLHAKLLKQKKHS